MASFMQEQSSVLYTKHIKSTSGIYQSSNINEVIRAILNLLIIFLQDFTHTKSTKHIQANKKHLRGTKLLVWCFVFFYAFYIFMLFVLFVCIKNIQKEEIRLYAFLCFYAFLTFYAHKKTYKRKKIACLMFCDFYAHKKHLRGRKSLVWCFVLFACVKSSCKKK